MPDGDVNAASFRTYNKATDEWSIWWLNMLRPGELDVPVVGKFKNGIGEFIADTEVNGVEVIMRFDWTVTDENTAQWEQAYSSDGGKNWERNWVMDFTRA